jgi:hypothetical protein
MGILFCGHRPTDEEASGEVGYWAEREVEAGDARARALEHRKFSLGARNTAMEKGRSNLLRWCISRQRKVLAYDVSSCVAALVRGNSRNCTTQADTWPHFDGSWTAGLE